MSVVRKISCQIRQTCCAKTGNRLLYPHQLLFFDDPAMQRLDFHFHASRSARRQGLSGVLALLASLPLWAATTFSAPPGLGPEGLAAYQAYAKASLPRAFAIAPGGAWGWQGHAASGTQAQAQALASCQQNTRQKCLLYAVDHQVMLDARQWAQGWGPRLASGDAQKAITGTLPGQRFPDLAFRDAQGKNSHLHGQDHALTLVHFWGSWCPPCRKEMPELQTLYEQAKTHRNIRFVILQGREPYSAAQRWAARQNLRLPLADSGSSGEEDKFFHLHGGATLPDREVARLFPSTYLLDRQGIVIFSRHGPVHDWPAYLPLLRDAAQAGRK